jgi:hypothetical protein
MGMEWTGMEWTGMDPETRLKDTESAPKGLGRFGKVWKTSKKTCQKF